MFKEYEDKFQKYYESISFENSSHPLDIHEFENSSTLWIVMNTPKWRARCKQAIVTSGGKL